MDSKDHVHGDEHVTAGKLAGEGLGGAAAGAAGAAIGSFAGPVGTLIGGLAGVVGGWWAGKSAVEASHKYSPETIATTERLTNRRRRSSPTDRMKPFGRRISSATSRG